MARERYENIDGIRAYACIGKVGEIVKERENIIIADCEKEELETLIEGLGKNGRQYVTKLTRPTSAEREFSAN